jgi:hypothetical protein
VSLDTTSTSAAAPGVLGRLFRLALTLLLLHATATTALIPILGGWTLLYALFPPFLMFIVWDGWSTAPQFITLAFGTAVIAALALRRAHAAASTRLSRPARLCANITLALWIPIGCGECVRWALMHSTLQQSDAECRGTRSLVASIRQHHTAAFDQRREPHAWMMRDGVAWLWSYRSLRFEAAPGWSGASTLAAECMRDPVRRGA